jgi:hypothetical protein
MQGLGIAMFGAVVFLFVNTIVFHNFLFRRFHGYIQEGQNGLFDIVFCFHSDVCRLFADKHYYQYELRFILRGYWEMVLFFLLGIKLVRILPFIKH